MSNLKAESEGKKPVFTNAHIRIARPTDDITALLPFYQEGLGFEVIGSFENHQGFDGVMLGHPHMPYHLEFTRHRGHTVGKTPSQENLLVFYLPDFQQWTQSVERMERAGFTPVVSYNPYWDVHGKTFEDADGYRVVLQHATWV